MKNLNFTKRKKEKKRCDDKDKTSKRNKIEIEKVN